MNKLFILGVSLSFVLGAGTAMAAGDQTSEMFQTLGQMQTVETTAITQMTDSDLNAVEGKMRYKGNRGYKGHKGGYNSYDYTKYYRSNTNTTDQFNACLFCSASGGNGGGGNINQLNQNATFQN